jgi:glucose/arabinose dehydrogenase
MNVARYCWQKCVFHHIFAAYILFYSALLYSAIAFTPSSSLLNNQFEEPVVNDDRLRIEQAVIGKIDYPSSMTFLGPNDILVLEKYAGTVRRIVNGNLLAEPLLRVNVSNEEERGMLGIATSKQQSEESYGKTTYVFLYYTEPKKKGQSRS